MRPKQPVLTRRDRESDRQSCSTNGHKHPSSEGPMKNAGPTEKKENAIILIVDDEALVRNVTSAMLNRFGYETKTVDNGIKALEIFAQGRIDLVLSDVDMAPISGLELLIELKKQDPEVKVVIMSGKLTAQRQEKLQNNGAIAILRKPFPMQTLQDTIKKALESA